MLPSLREERGATYSPFLPISPQHRHRAAGADRRPRRRRRHHPYDDPDTGERSTTPVTGGHASCNGSPTGRCAGSRSASTTRWPARTSSTRSSSPAKSAARSAARRRRASTTSSSSTSRARRSPSPRATGSPSTSGCAMRARRASRSSCIASPRRRSGSTSTSSRATSTSISSFWRLPAPGPAAAAGQSGLAHPFRRAAGAEMPISFAHAAQSGLRLECGERRDAMGFHRPLPRRA